MAVQRGRSEHRGEAYSVPYVEPLSDARTKLADFFSILLGSHTSGVGSPAYARSRDYPAFAAEAASAE